MLESTIAYGLDFLLPAADATVGASLKTCGEFSRVELDFMLDVAGEQGVMIDLGAKIGSIALPFARLRPAWQVIAVEASRAIAGVLSANALNNRLYNVTVINAAVGPGRAIAEFPAVGIGHRGNFGGIGFGQQHAQVEPVAMLPLDEIAGDHVSLVKLDVEGFEPQVLKGAGRLLDRREAVWLVEASTEHRDASEQVIAAFHERGYGVYWFFVPFATPRSPKATPQEPLKGDVNIVALPPGRENRWALTPVDGGYASLPDSIASYTYLGHYGYKLPVA